MTTSNLYEQIQQFYDASSGLWERVWGEHMHHGYYGERGDRRLDRRQAQIDLIEELLAWTGVQLSKDLNSQVSTILDVGCGIGGSSLYLAQKFNASATGITLSPVQAARATERAREAGIPSFSGPEGGGMTPDTRAEFRVANALELPFADNSFDLVWTLESGEHMPDKKKFLQECYRVLAPGGALMMATWCHRPVAPPAAPLSDRERHQLMEIYKVYCLPYVISLPEYETIAREIGFQGIQVADWSEAVAPFWDFVIDSAFDPSALLGLLFSGWQTIQGALALGLMRDGYKQGLIRYGLLCGTKS
ncbi:methyltransferase domain-containing protein [Laspinema sp. D1]|uniref:Methyltransferase domain-containing protein n=1 Tax=Laspinema palackyanum D2a TaxID=2953684 RepID=A0ABT2MU87_9CYAN|nr:methyltransferase domain-containing protein [Laspinema sp. D2a]